MFRSVVPLTKKTRVYSFCFQALIFLFFFYVFHAASSFFAQHIFPENIRGFSVINPHFEYWNSSLSFFLAFGSLVALMAYEKFREYLYDAADELCRLSWVGKDQLRLSTGVVLVTIFLSSVILFLMDTFLGQISTKIISSAGQ